MALSGLTDADLLSRLRRLDVHWDQSLALFADSFALDALEASKLRRAEVMRTGWRTTLVDRPFFARMFAQPFKIYEGSKRVDLSEHIDIEAYRDGVRSEERIDVDALFLRRRSHKRYRRGTLETTTLAKLLFLAYGVSRIEYLHDGSIPWRFRPIPSPGGLCAAEIYVVAVNTELESGIYHYRPDVNALELIRLGVDEEIVNGACGISGFINDADKICLVLVTTAMIERMFVKYADRAIKFILIETGILGQQLTLVAERLGLGTCMLGGYFDDEVNSMIGVDGVLESVQNVMVAGYPDK